MSSVAQSTENFSIKNPIHFLALGFGSGLSPVAPGTFGTLAALPLFYLASFASSDVYVALTILISILGIFICDKAAKDAGVHDHGAIVWDEIAGYFVTMLFVPPTLINILLGFVLFRFFDILKPWPISFIDKQVHGGFGIMLDDIIAGGMALLVLQLLLFYQWI